MKGYIMRQVFTLILAAFFLTLFSGCTKMRVGAPIDPTVTAESKITTRDELIKRVGIPDNIIKNDGYTYYLYVFSYANGGGFGIGNVVASLVIENTQLKSNTYIVKMDESDRVMDIYALRQERASYSIWPFGD